MSSGKICTPLSVNHCQDIDGSKKGNKRGLRDKSVTPDNSEGDREESHGE